MGLKEAKDNYQKLGSKGFANKWKDGMKQIPQITLLKLDIYGYAFSIVGTILACVLLLIYGRILWYLIFAFCFSIINLISSLISKYQQLKVLKMMNVSNSQEDIEKMMNEIKKDV